MNLIYKPFYQISLGIFISMALSSHAKPKAWGFYAHQLICRQAIYTLPTQMIGFFKRHQISLEKQSVLPDQRRYVLDEEASRHYIDLDLYPLDFIRGKSWKQMLAFMEQDSLEKHGKVVWHIPNVYRQLVQAFQRKDSMAIIKQAAELAHYISDAHVPLHTSSNYDGQKTGQTGLHALWESRIPEMIQGNLLDFVGPAAYLKDIQASAWDWVLQAHQGLSLVFEKEKNVRENILEKEQFQYENRGGQWVKMPSPSLIKKYHQALNAQVENQFRAALKNVGSAWYSAWVDAGQENLN